MPGVEKSDVKVLVKDKTVDISAEHGEKEISGQCSSTTKS